MQTMIIIFSLVAVSHSALALLRTSLGNNSFLNFTAACKHKILKIEIFMI